MVNHYRFRQFTYEARESLWMWNTYQIPFPQHSPDKYMKAVRIPMTGCVGPAVSRRKRRSRECLCRDAYRFPCSFPGGCVASPASAQLEVWAESLSCNRSHCVTKFIVGGDFVKQQIKKLQYFSEVGSLLSNTLKILT